MDRAPQIECVAPRLEITEAYAPSLEAAREKLELTAPQAERQMVCEEVLSDGKPLTLEGVADTVEQAFGSCESRIPAGGSITERTVLFEPGAKALFISARDQASAKQAATSKLTSTAAIKEMRLVERGRKGFLGIGRTDDKYEVSTWQQAVVSVKIDTQARVRWTLQSTDLEGDIDRSGLVEWLNRCAKWFTRFAEQRGSALRPYVPGSPTFICAQERCTKTCCKFSRSHLVVVWREFADTVKTQYGMENKDFIDTWPGFHVLKTRDQNKCVFVDDSNHCKIYNIRPRQCVSYPFELAFFRLKPNGSLGLENTTEVYQRAESSRASPLAFYKAGSQYDFLIPLVVYDSDCPGFTGGPISAEEYLKLAGEIFEPCRATNATVRYF